MPQQTPLHPGDPRRLGRYRLGGRIAGIPSDDPIFIGIDPAGTEVCISLLHGDWAHDAAARDRFAAEAAVAKRVPPFCAARVLDAGQDPAGAYLISEYIPGPSLLEVVAASGVRRTHELEAAALAMATGLASVHQAGLVHGSFGPEYVIMAADGPPRVVEFGITPPYGVATPSADMLAWAQTVVFAALGRPAATMDDLDVLPGLIREPVERCLDPEPTGRPAARTVVLDLLGDAALPAGVLAEGARRAARLAARGRHDQLSAQSAADGPRQAGQRTHGGFYPSARPPSAHPPSYRDGRPVDRPAGTAGSRHSHAIPPADGRYPERSRQAPAGRGRRVGWLIGAVVVIAAAVAVAVHLSEGTPGQPTANKHPSSTDQAAAKSQSPSESASPSEGPTTPAGFVGSWTGLVRQASIDTLQVSVGFARGATSGTISYSGAKLTCSGALNLMTATPTALTLSQDIIHGKSKCENGSVTVTLTSRNTVRFNFRNDGGPIASGTLNRS